MRDNPNLDLLRSIAVCLVVVSHLPLLDELRQQPSTHDAVVAIGRVGVGIFFVHTCLVLMQSLERSGPAAAAFYVRRALRIYPLSIAVVLFLALVLWVGGKPLDGGVFVSNLLLVQNITGHRSMPDPLWSLPYEVQMYVVLPWLYTLTTLSGAALHRALAATTLVAMAVLGFAAAADVLALLAYVPCFLGGVLAFALSRHIRARFSAVVLCAVAAAAAVAVPAMVATGTPETPLLWALAVLLAVTIPLCRPIEWPPLVVASKLTATYSYGVYLTHVIAIGIAFGPLSFLPAAAQWGAFVVLLVAVPIALYRWIERPGIALGVRLADRLGAPPPAGSAARA